MTMARKTEGQGGDRLDAEITKLAKSIGIDLDDPALEDALAKGEDDGGDGDGDGDGDGAGGDGDGDGDEDLGKSHEMELFDLLKSFPETAGLIESSDFMKRFALVVSQSNGRMAKSLDAALEAQDQVNLFMAKSMQGVATMLEEVRDTINAISNTPAGKRAIASAAGTGGNLAKSFGAGAGAAGEEAVRKERKERLKVEEAMTKAIIAGELSQTAAAYFDREKTLPPSEMEIVEKYLAS